MCLGLGTAATLDRPTPRCAGGGKGEGVGEVRGGTAADLNMEQSSLWCCNKELEPPCNIPFSF